jgi:hypothetical protein
MNEYPKRVLSLGAGVQSTTLLLMMIHGEIPKADAVIFADTGWEPKIVYTHLSKLQALMAENNMPFYLVTAGNIRQDALNPNKKFASMPLYTLKPDGNKSMVRRQCTREYKIDPVNKMQRQLAGLKKGERCKEHRITTVIGISYDESQRMRDPQFSWIRNDYPLVDMKITRQDCIKWCADHGYDRPPRSACIGCPFKNNEQWRLLKDEMPDEWNDAVDFDFKIRELLTSDDRFYAVPFLHKDLKPLDEVDLRSDQEKGVFSLFDDGFAQECEGMCGI